MSEQFARALIRPEQNSLVKVPGHCTNTVWKELAFCSTEGARSLLPYSMAVRLCVLPLAEHRDLSSGGRVVSVVVGGESDAFLLKELRFAFGCEVILEKQEKEQVARAIEAAYHGNSQALAFAASRANAEISPAKRLLPETGREEAIDNIGQRPIPLLLESILNRALALSASDVHLEPSGDRYRLRFRIDGLLREDPDAELATCVCSDLSRRIKVLARLDTTLLGQPQDGGFTYETSQWSIRLRVSVLPQVNGEKIVIRLLDNNFLERVPTSANRAAYFAAVGMPTADEQLLISYLGAGSGVILLCGPTGSGKSTLLYAALHYLNEEWRNIVTIEDPVERLIPGINQTQVCRDRGLDYANLLPPLLRQDPDIIMIGEIREPATAETVFTAGLTGHLVLSTVHAGNCLEVFPRLGQFGLNSPLIASALKLVISQRLLPKNCLHCRVWQRLEPYCARLFNVAPDTEAAASSGCEVCSFSGIGGRLAVFEFLPVQERICEALTSNERSQDNDSRPAPEQLKKAALSCGYEPYAVPVRTALLSGYVSPVSALRALGIAPEIAGYAKS